MTVTDANGCTSTATTTVTQPATAVSVSIGTTTNVSCLSGNDGSASATAGGGTGTITFAWNTGAASNTVTGLTAGIYTVTATDANGCTSTAVTTVTQPATAVSVSINTTTNVLCAGGNSGDATAAGLGGTGSLQYTWSTGGTNATVTGLSAGNYTVTATDGNGCTAMAVATITEPASLSLSISTTVNVSCFGGSDGEISALGSGGTGTIGFAWNTGAAGASIAGLTAGTYTVTATDANGCSQALTTSINEPVQLSLATTVADALCHGNNDGSVTASTSGGTTPYTYVWSNGGTGSVNTGLGAGNYTVTVTDANGCTIMASTTVNEPTPLSLVISSTGVQCSGAGDGTATATLSGGTAPYTYLWSNGNTGGTATGITAGPVFVSATDANGCTIIDSVHIGEPDELVVILDSVKHASCNGLSDGSATVAVSGGTPPYVYLWSGGSTSVTAGSLGAGNHTVTVTDDHGCEGMDSVAVSEPPLLTVTIQVNQQFLDDCMGTATALPAGGTPPYAFLWNDPLSQATSTATGLCTGNYCVQITDANGCMWDTCGVEVLLSTGELTGNTGIVIYPNPNKGDFILELPLNGGHGSVRASIINTLGQEVWRGRLSEGPNPVMLRQVSPGLHTIRFEGNDRTPGIRFIVH